MYKKIRSEVIFEVAHNQKACDGFYRNNKILSFGIECQKIILTNDEISKKIGRDKGTYVSLNFDDLLFFDAKQRDYLSKILIRQIKKILTDNKIVASKVLVVGLGNGKFASDSLGCKVINHVLITKPYLEKKLFSKKCMAEIYAISPGVYGTTGLESGEIISSICKSLTPDVVIAIDSMVALNVNSLCKSIQLSDTKLLPGGGVGNERQEISFETLGVKVLAIGVPMVINIKKLSSSVVVTPKDIEQKVGVLSRVISQAINKSFVSISSAEYHELTN